MTTSLPNLRATNEIYTWGENPPRQKHNPKVVQDFKGRLTDSCRQGSVNVKIRGTEKTTQVDPLRR